MGEQLQITSNGRIMGKVEIAIKRIKSFEPEDGYYVAFSGGKDSQCIYHLCKMAGVKFNAHYNVTSVDPPELVQFIRKNYPDVQMKAQHYSDNNPKHYYTDGRAKPITMWSLIEDHTMPPMRKSRYCCANLKEPGGEERIVITGVRWAESNNRKHLHGLVDFQSKPDGTKRIANAMNAKYKLNKKGNVIMNDDNDANRRMVEQCYRTRKTIVNPIVDWTDDDVWGFLNDNNIEHCSLYDEGFLRLGCIGCPLAGGKQMKKQFERWPQYKFAYIRAIQRMIKAHPNKIKIFVANSATKTDLSGCPDEKKAEAMFDYWLNLCGK